MGHQKGGENSSGQQQPPASANGSNSNKQHGHIIAGNRDSAPFEPSVEDQVAVGTDQILQSPHVSEGPGRVANAPVPSVFVSLFCDTCARVWRYTPRLFRFGASFPFVVHKN